MANVVTNTRTVTGKNTVVQYITLASDGSEETDLVVYDSSAVATALGIADPLMCSIKAITISSSVSTASRINLEFDASTDVLAFSVPSSVCKHLCFQKIGYLKNTAGSGITGDILLTTTGLEAGDHFTLILEVQPR